MSLSSSWKKLTSRRQYIKRSELEIILEEIILGRLNQYKGEILAAIDDLHAVVAQIGSDVATAVGLIGQLQTQINDLEQKVAAGVDPAQLAGDVQALKDTAAQLEGSMPQVSENPPTV